jgi:hypothetical protein
MTGGAIALGVSGGSSQSVTLQQPGGGVTNNRIASVNGGPGYQYDAAGNVTYDAAHSYSYDAESRIVTVDSGNAGTYVYDSANRRVKKVAGGYTTYYVWEGSEVIAEYSNSPAGSGTRFYHPDRLSNRVITDGAGVVKGAMDNLPFGEDGGIAGNWGPGGTFSGIHFASDDRLAELETSFSSDLTNNILRAGHTLHAIEDSHGAHKNYRGFLKLIRFGHAFTDIASWVGIGNSPDNVIGDEKFVSAANEVYQVLTGSSATTLTADQMNGLIDAIIAGCGPKASKKFVVTRPPSGGGGGGGGVGFGGGYPGWWYSMWNFVNWVNSITVSGPKMNL